MIYVICAYREYSLELYRKLKKNYDFILITKKKDLTLKKIKKINPKFIFFPDWSWIVPNDIIENYNCICFHESPLPKFRGGSPIQNQIIRGKTKSKTTAFIMNNKIDAGDIVMQMNLSLEGTITEIFSKMLENDYKIITKIIKQNYKTKKQIGKPTTYRRRTPEQSELKNLNHSKIFLHNFIRMLGDPYPNAFLKIGKKKLIFKKSQLNGQKLIIEGEII